MRMRFGRILLLKLALIVLFISAPLSMAQYGDPGPPPAPDTPRAQDPREIEARDPAFAPNPVLDAPDPALSNERVISEPDPVIDPGPGGIATESEDVDVAPGEVITEPGYRDGRREPIVEGDPLVRQSDVLVDQPDPLVEQPGPLVQQPEPLVEQPDPLVEQSAPIVPEGEPAGRRGGGGRGGR